MVLSWLGSPSQGTANRLDSGETTYGLHAASAPILRLTTPLPTLCVLEVHYPTPLTLSLDDALAGSIGHGCPGFKRAWRRNVA